MLHSVVERRKWVKVGRSEGLGYQEAISLAKAVNLANPNRTLADGSSAYVDWLPSVEHLPVTIR